MSSVGLCESTPVACSILNWPAGVNNKLPSGANVRRLKKLVQVSFSYNGAFLAPRVPRLPILGEFGMTAGSGIDGAGDADRRDEPNDDRRLCDVGGGFIGRDSD